MNENPIIASITCQGTKIQFSTQVDVLFYNISLRRDHGSEILSVVSNPDGSIDPKKFQDMLTTYVTEMATGRIQTNE